MYPKLTETTFKNEFRNWTKGMAWQAVPRLHWTPGHQINQIWPPWLTRAGSHVGVVPRAETKTAERDGPETALQTICNDLLDEKNSKIFSELL